MRCASARKAPARCRALPAMAAAAREPTVTDANLLLGRLDAEHFLGGEMKLDRRGGPPRGATRIAEPLGLDVMEAADGILRIAATAMSYAVKAVTTERGPRCRQLHDGRLRRRRAAACLGDRTRDRHPARADPVLARAFLRLWHAVQRFALRLCAILLPASLATAPFEAIEEPLRRDGSRWAARRSRNPRSGRSAS